MSELKQQYKNPHPGFGNVDHRILRDYKHVESLKEMRTRAFYDNRDLVNISVASPQS
ncbi:disks large-associated protein 5, partial [Lasius niger]